MDRFVAPMELLVGRRPAYFPLEPELRVFQIQFWLWSRSDDHWRAYTKAAMLFLALELQRRNRLITGSGGVKRINRLLEDKKLSALFTFVFTESRSLYSFTHVPSLPSLFRRAEETRGEIEQLDCVTEYALRLRLTKDNPPLSDVLQLYTKSGYAKFGMTKIKEIERRRRARAPYYFASRAPQFSILLKTYRKNRFFAHLSGLAQNPELWTRYFERIASLQTALGLDDSADALLFKLTLDPVQVEGLSPITVEELDRAGILEGGRRASIGAHFRSDQVK